MKPQGWVSHPDDVERLVEEWAAERGEVLQVERVEQYTGRPVFALTLASAGDDRSRPALFFHKPHAHEPAPCAAMMNVLAKLLFGRGLDGEPPPIDPAAVLDSLVLTFVPDANPGGTERAPVQWWDGTQYTNEEFWAWMRGLDPRTGKMWERYDKWDDRTVEPKPARLGIVYEQVSEHEYVEPNRHHDSSLFRLLFRLLDRHNYAMIMGLHQTEFVGTVYDGMVILPILFDEQPQALKDRELEVGRNVVAWWQRFGGRPMQQIEPLGYSGAQAEYFRRAWGDLYQRCASITSEVRNNSLLCPPSQQRALTEGAIWAAIETAMGWPPVQ
ncbi:MAG: hypothetical protein J7M26_09565 [Armatimonadetes bacterium]|nr:hypothetical protein [Armatimonadota bacterium]